MADEPDDVISSTVRRLEQGTLTKEQLLEAFGNLAGRNGRRQDLLYLQAVESGLDSNLIGFKMMRGGRFVDEPDSEEDWPYRNVLEAINEGWRVIGFPNMALCLDENRTYGLGFEFILEKWS